MSANIPTTETTYYYGCPQCGRKSRQTSDIKNFQFKKGNRDRKGIQLNIRYFIHKKAQTRVTKDQKV